MAYWHEVYTRLGLDDSKKLMMYEGTDVEKKTSNEES